MSHGFCITWLYALFQLGNVAEAQNGAAQVVIRAFVVMVVASYLSIMLKTNNLEFAIVIIFNCQHIILLKIWQQEGWVFLLEPSEIKFIGNLVNEYIVVVVFVKNLHLRPHVVHSCGKCICDRFGDLQLLPGIQTFLGNFG